MKKCSKCKDMLPAEAFSKSKNTKSGLRSSCKECEKVGRICNSEAKKDYSKQYYKDNLGYYTDYNKAYGTLYYEANKKGILDLHKSTEQLTSIRLLRLNTS